MREIKFRAWDKIENRMRDDLPVGYGLHLSFGIVAFPDDERCVAQGHQFELMQYTGLKDKNGKEIYEGDILATEHFVDSKRRTHFVHHKVEWREDHGLWWAHNLKAKMNDGCIQIWVLLKTGTSEVIGNIYENPELLEDGHD